VEFPDYPGIARLYCEMILSEEVPACSFIKQAAQRYLDMLEEAARPDALYFFSDAWCCDFLSFFEKLRLPSGGKVGDTFVAQPWQIWIGCATFGFRRNDPEVPVEAGARLTREVYIEVPRGSGKSPFSAAIGLYCFLCEGENGSQIFIGAPKEEQARYVFDPMKAIVETTPGLREHFGMDATNHKITKANDPMARVRMISSIAEREDGANPHVLIMEELHAQDEGLFNVMDSSMGKRVNNLFLSITTAGQRAQGVCWNTRKRLIGILEGNGLEISFFGLIFTLDKEEIEDKRIAHDPARWIKCNPMWGITLFKSNLIERYVKAKAESPSAMLEFERTRLNIWSDGAGGLIASESWEKCRIPPPPPPAVFDPMEYRGRTAWIGADLASKNDIASIAILIDNNDNLDEITIITENFVPSQCATFKHSEFGPMYDSWVRKGHLTVTPGPVTDYRVIEERIRFWCTVFDVQAIVFDNYQSNQIIASLHEDGFPAMQMQPGVKTVSHPFLDLQAKINGGLVKHDGNQCTAWMVSNAVGYIDKRDNVLPQKEKPGSPYKIDALSAMIAANVARCDQMLEIKRRKKSVYEKRGLLGGEE
jgi:phage terminase large subunit-like protein